MAMLATGLILDMPEEGSIYPSAGGNSADPAVQAVYWRCLTVLFASARVTNPDLRLVLFSNVAPPVVDGVPVADALSKIGVENRLVPLRARLPRERTPTWGNVLYYLDILDSLEAEPDDLTIALVDSDVVVTQPIVALFDRAAVHDFVGYVADTAPDENVNGMTRRDMAQASAETDGKDHGDTVPHYGGELLVCRLGAWRQHRGLFIDLFMRSIEGKGAIGKARTEEHFWSIAFATMSPERIARANDILKRIWTSPRHSNVAPGDELMALWHLPAEKRYGFADLFADLAKRDFGVGMAPAAFRALARARCGLPRKSISKIVRDGVRQIAAKMGLMN